MQENSEKTIRVINKSAKVQLCISVFVLMYKGGFVLLHLCAFVQKWYGAKV